MDYRLEVVMMNGEGSCTKSLNFEADSDEDASNKVKDKCQEEQDSTNTRIINSFYHCSVTARKLLRIDQPEISHEIPF